MWTRAELKERAKTAFSGNYWWCVLAALILSIITGGGGGSVSAGSSSGSSAGASSGSSGESLETNLTILLAVLLVVAVVFVVALVIGFALSAFLTNILEVGGCRFFIKNTEEKATVAEFAYGFKNNYLNMVGVMFQRTLYIFLWSLLFIIPGIIKSYEYRMVPYIMAENPDMSGTEAFAISKAMMDGNKWDAFVLDLSFIGWDLLSILTCGILSVFYVNPYRYATNAELYLELKGRGLN